MQVRLTAVRLKELADAQRTELSRATYDKAAKPTAKTKEDKSEPLISASMLGLGGIPPTLDTLSGVACRKIVRSHVLSFASLRQMRFGAGPEGDAACRALLAALALNALARSDSELYVRANCDLRESGLAAVDIDQRGGGRLTLDPLTIDEADALLAAALADAEAKAGVSWNGVVLQIVGNPAIAAGAVADEDESGTD
jgi:CRISPR-associated protein Csb1